ncbi:MAG: acyl-CoA dehydrogenase [Acidobacteria bacterium]|nr:MAG: acyl-CoA dehydrogenase [Acidobacteriota bacterium]
MAVVAESVLTDQLLTRCRERAAGYDRDNKFFQEDFDELKAAGYLRMAIPSELGGLGMNLAEVGRETRKLAMYAPATALALNMHNYWVGDAADAWRSGDKSLQWILEEAAAGEVFAAGHAEHGNDIPGLLSTTKAVKVDGGYTFTGRKSFGSLTPVWTRFGLHGMDTSDPAAPKVVHGFMTRDAKGYTIKDTWDVLGMRATRSDDTVLEGAFVPDKYIARVVPAGAAGADNFVAGFLTWALYGFANIYYGLSMRVREVLVEQLKTKTSIALTRPMIYHPEVQHGIAEITMDIEAMGPHIEAVGSDWTEGRVGPDWFIKIFSVKHKVVDAAFRIADRALDLSGGFGMFKKSELERLFRDARAGKCSSRPSWFWPRLPGRRFLRPA